MKIVIIDGADPAGNGGAMRGHEMGKALTALGNDVAIIPTASGMDSAALTAAPDAVVFTGTWHCLSWFGADILNLTDKCDRAGIPCLWWFGSNGSVFGCADPDPAVRARAEAAVIEQICAREFIGVICPYSIDIYQRHGVPREKMRLVPTVFDGELFAPAESRRERYASMRLRREFGIPDSACLLGTTGHTPNSKGGDDVIRAIALLRDEMPDLHYLVQHTPAANLNRVKAVSPDKTRIGNSEFDVLQLTKQLAVDLGVADRVHFMGMRLKREAMPLFYHCLDVYCSPSKAENLGQPLVESQLCGLPLVTYQGFSFDFVVCPDTAEQVAPCRTVTDDYGLVIPEVDPHDLAIAITRARITAETPESAEFTREWTYKKFHWSNATNMVDALNAYRRMM